VRRHNLKVIFIYIYIYIFIYINIKDILIAVPILSASTNYCPEWGIVGGESDSFIHIYIYIYKTPTKHTNMDTTFLFCFICVFAYVVALFCS
jgi:hypothetical protein